MQLGDIVPPTALRGFAMEKPSITITITKPCNFGPLSPHFGFLIKKLINLIRLESPNRIAWFSAVFSHLRADSNCFLTLPKDFVLHFFKATPHDSSFLSTWVSHDSLQFILHTASTVSLHCSKRKGF